MSITVFHGTAAILTINGKKVHMPPSVSVSRKHDESDAQFKARLASIKMQLNLAHFLGKLGIKEARALSRDLSVDTPIQFSSRYLGQWSVDSQL